MAASASNFFGSFINSQRTFSNLIAKMQMKNIETVSQNVGLNSAYAFSQDIRENSLEQNTTQNTPMWFATNMSAFSQLTTKQKQLLSLFQKSSPFIESLLFN